MTDIDPVPQDLSPVPDKRSIPISVAAARVLFLLLAAIWSLFGIISLVDDSVKSALTIAILMFINAAVLIFTGWGIGKQQKRFFYLGMIVLLGNIFLTITDEFGRFDLIVLIIYVVLFFLLVASRSNYRTPREEQA